MKNVIQIGEYLHVECFGYKPMRCWEVITEHKLLQRGAALGSSWKEAISGLDRELLISLSRYALYKGWVCWDKWSIVLKYCNPLFLEVVVEDNIKGTMCVCLFVCDVVLEHWSGNSHMIKIPHQLSSVIHMTDHSHNTKKTIKNGENSHSFTVLSQPPYEG